MSYVILAIEKIKICFRNEVKKEKIIILQRISNYRCIAINIRYIDTIK